MLWQSCKLACPGLLLTGPRCWNGPLGTPCPWFTCQAAPSHLAMGWVMAHMTQFGSVVQSARGMDRSFGNAFNGIIHFTIQLQNYITFHHFIDIKDEGRHLTERLFVFSDQHRHCCFRCCHTGQIGQFCRAAIKA